MLMISPKEQTEVMERTAGNVYFCVRLGTTEGMNVSSTLAKEIAIKNVSDYYVKCFFAARENQDGRKGSF